MKDYNGKPVQVREHFYQDDPKRGPADARTNLPGAEYYFLGNGRIQAALQVCSREPGTPVGLLIMDPETFGPKSRALSFDSGRGLLSTSLTILAKGRRHSPRAGKIKSRWVARDGVPAVNIAWGAGAFRVEETFFCTSSAKARMIREIRLQNVKEKTLKIVIETGLPGRKVERRFELAAGRERRFWLAYTLSGKPASRLNIGWSPPASASREIRQQWQRACRIHFTSSLLNHFSRAALFQLPSCISRSGKLDGGIWQYNREWVRDQAMIAVALTISGQFELAGTILRRLLREFVTSAGKTVDSSERRPPHECELDQNGALLVAVETYVLWSGDDDILKKYWKKIEAAARFPLQKVFVHVPSGLLHNRREYWERHAAHGIEEGLEIAHQLWVSLGLLAVARLAHRLNKDKTAQSLEKAGQKLKRSMLENKVFGFVHNGHLIKRRKTSGEVQSEVNPPPNSGLPGSVPLFEPGRHFLNPDTSTVLPIAWEFVPPQSRLAARTLAEVEKLWNQRWRGGGYGRYHVSSEPDSPGPWPFPSLFVARAYFEANQDKKVWRILRWLGNTQGAKAGSWFEFYGPRPTPPYPQVGIIPWTWAELAILFIHHIAGVRPESFSLRLRPRLLSGLRGYQASLRLRKARIYLEVKRARRRDHPGYWINRKFWPYAEEGLRIPYPKEDVHIKARIPFSLRKISPSP